MSCQQCLGLEEVFGERAARSDLRRYRRRGPSRTTRALVAALVAQGVTGSSLLDIGGGVGALPFTLLERGASSAKMADASRAYLSAAREEAERRGLLDRVDFSHGDFVALSTEEPEADVVTLDRVLCCYHDVSALVGASAPKAKRLYGLVYPRDTWWIRAGSKLVNLVLSFSRHGYRTYVHPQALVERLIEARGLRRIDRREAGMWQVVVYVRVR